MNLPQPEAFHPKDCLEMAVAHGNVHRQSFTCILFSGERVFFFESLQWWRFRVESGQQKNMDKIWPKQLLGKEVVGMWQATLKHILTCQLFPRIGWIERFWNQQIRNISISILWSHLFHLFACQERENHVLFLRQVKKSYLIPQNDIKLNHQLFWRELLSTHPKVDQNTPKSRTNQLAQPIQEISNGPRTHRRTDPEKTWGFKIAPSQSS